MDMMTFEDTTIVTFLALKKFKVTPQKTPSGKVQFIVQGENINGAIDELYSNSPVGALDYIKTFKALRSSIFALKGSQR